MLIGEIAALATATFWAFSSLFFTFAVKKVGVIQVNVDRLFFAALYIFSTMVVFGIKPDINLTQIFYLILSSIAGLVLGDTFLFKAFSEIGPRISLLIMTFAPPFSAIFAYFFLGEALGAFAIAGILVTTFGVALVVFEKVEGTNKFKIKNKLGFFWATLGMLGQASGLILAKYALMEHPLNAFLASFTRTFSAWLMLLPIGFITRRYQFGYKVYFKHPRSILGPTIGAILGPYLGITLSLVSINYAKVGIASTLMSITPILMLPISHFYFKEKLPWQSYVGSVIAIIGIAILFLK